MILFYWFFQICNICQNIILTVNLNPCPRSQQDLSCSWKKGRNSWWISRKGSRSEFPPRTGKSREMIQTTCFWQIIPTSMKSTSCWLPNRQQGWRILSSNCNFSISCIVHCSFNNAYNEHAQLLFSSACLSQEKGIESRQGTYFEEQWSTKEKDEAKSWGGLNFDLHSIFCKPSDSKPLAQLSD